MNTLIVLVIILIIFSVWNLLSLYDLKKFNRSYRELKDDKYYELKYKMEFITAGAIVGIAVGGFFGYKMFDDLNKNADNLNVRIGVYAKKLKSNDSLILEYNKLIPEYKTQIKDAKDSLIELQNKYRLNAKTYFVKGIKIDQKALVDNKGSIRVSFKKLRESNSSIPDIFDKEPFISPIILGEGIIMIKKITREYFEYKFSGFTELSLLDIKEGKENNTPNKNDANSFDLIIIEGVN